MQTINANLQYGETALPQRDSAAMVVDPKQNYGRASDVFRFPGATPERERVRRTVSNTTRMSQSPEAVRQRQITSAVNNAYTQFAQQKGQLTNEQAQAWAQWTLQIGRIIEYLRTEKINEPPRGFIASMFASRPTLRQLIQEESELGGTLFGPVADGHHRQFYCLDPTNWIWYEEQTSAKGEVLSNTTTRYEIHANGILKVQDNAPYYFITGDELINLTKRIQAYYNRMCQEKYHRDPVTAKPLAA